ncbi:MAG: hypothetical protein Q7U75_03680 [Desulfobacterales bacterium]|nr:hypothetical protein [Desulfobacterales bacterium]
MPDGMQDCQTCGNSVAVRTHNAGDYLGCRPTGGERYDDPVAGQVVTLPSRCSDVAGSDACSPKPLSGLRATLHRNWNATMGDGERG